MAISNEQLNWSNHALIKATLRSFRLVSSFGGGVTKLLITFELYGICLYMMHIWKGN